MNASEDGTQPLELLSFGGSIEFQSSEANPAAPVTVEVDPTTIFQTIHGFGGAYTEATGLNYLKLSAENQERMIRLYFDPLEGIGYTSGRVPMGSADFAVNDYSLDICNGNTSAPDPTLKCFDGNMTRDSGNGVIDLLKAALSVAPQKLFITPWSPPAWMKLPSGHGISMSGTASPNGLNPLYNVSLAAYFTAYAAAMKAKGVPLWGYTLQNEPTAVAGWPQCKYTAQMALEVLRDYVVPSMARDHPEMNLLIFDHNYDNVYSWAQVLYGDEKLRAAAWGAAVHWYTTPSLVSNLNRTHGDFPDKHIMHTEGCLCNGGPAGGKVVLPGSPMWYGLGEGYGFGLMSTLQNWAEGFHDWNMMLDMGGGPYHERPFSCNAPMIQNASDIILQTPYYYMGHFSKFLPPGTRVVGAMHYPSSSPPPAAPGSFYYQTALAASSPFGVLAGVTPNGTSVLLVMNAQEQAVNFNLKVGLGEGAFAFANVTAPAHSIQTLMWA